jgi:hypothetical protein
MSSAWHEIAADSSCRSTRFWNPRATRWERQRIDSRGEQAGCDWQGNTQRSGRARLFGSSVISPIDRLTLRFEGAWHANHDTQQFSLSRIALAADGISASALFSHPGFSPTIVNGGARGPPPDTLSPTLEGECGRRRHPPAAILGAPNGSPGEV